MCSLMTPRKVQPDIGHILLDIMYLFDITAISFICIGTRGVEAGSCNWIYMHTFPTALPP